MTPADPALTAQPPAPSDRARARIEAQLDTLTRLTEIGMQMAEACGRQVAGEAPEPVFAQDPGLVFARVSRAVRMTIALQSRLMKDLAVLDRVDEMARMTRASRRRMRLRTVLEQAVSAGIDADDRRDEDAIEDEIERVASDACERLTDAEDADLSGLSFDAALAAICADLGLTPQWAARLHAAAGAPPPPASDGAGRPDEPGDPAPPSRAAYVFAGAPVFAPLRPG